MSHNTSGTDRRHSAKRARGVLSRAGLAVGVALPLAGFASIPAQAAEAVQCNGTITNATVNGDLVVPDGASCQLDKVTVTGNVKLGQYANLLIMSSTVNGSTDPLFFRKPHGTYLNSYNSTFKGPVTMMAAWGAYLDRSSFSDLRFRSCYRGPCGEGETGPNWVYMRGSKVSGSLTWLQAKITVDDSTVGDLVGQDWAAVTSVVGLNRVRAGSATITSADLATCSSTISGDTFVGRQSYMSGTLPIVFGRPSSNCGGNEFMGSLTTVDQYSPVTMNNNVVRGQARQVVNYPAQPPMPLSGTGNRFLGGTTGAFTPFAASQGNSTQSLTTARLAAAKKADKGAETVTKVRKATAQAKKELKAKEKAVRQAAKRAGKVKMR